MSGEGEVSKIVLASSDRILSRIMGAEDDPMTERWELSSPIPGTRVINTWQVYQGMWLVLSVTEEGHYCIFHTIDLKKYTLVHDHASRILNIFYIDDGIAVFSAEDGWWGTTNAGTTWTELSLGPEYPVAMETAVIPLRDGAWALLAYGQDHKIHYCEYPGGTWAEVYDTTAIWTDKRYRAIAGCAAGVLAGAGSKLLRSTQAGQAGSWSVIAEVNGIIKSIVISNKSNKPIFLVVIEPLVGDTDQILWSYDLGDSLVPDLSRIGPVAAVQSVVPTGTTEISTSFVVLGKRANDRPIEYKILREE